MASILDSVNQLTQLVGQNRLELLLFRLNGRQRFGINVFKVREVLQCPNLTIMPKLHPYVRGVAHIRGHTISVIDLSMATGGKPIADLSKCFIIIAEYNRSVQGFLVGNVERIVNMTWESILPPPKGAGRFNYMTAVTEVDGELVEILDVEKILEEISPANVDVSTEVAENSKKLDNSRPVLVADDSSVARKQVERALHAIGVNCLLAKDGKDALNMLLDMAKQGPIEEQIALVISDIEMPEMDGHALTRMIKADPTLKGLPVILFSSLISEVVRQQGMQAGADDQIAKPDLPHLTVRAGDLIRKFQEKHE